MPQPAVAQRGMFAAKLEQSLHIGEDFLLLARAARLRERVVRISNPAAGEIAPVVRIAAPRHPNLIAVVNLRNAPESERESKRQLQLRRRAAFGARDSRYIVIRKKRDQHLWMNIKGIVPQHVRDASGGRISQQYIAKSKKQWKIKDRGKPAINAVIAPYTTDKKRCHARIGMKHLANSSQPGIEPMQSSMPVCPELPRHVGKRVDTVAVQPGYLRPPDAVLQKVLLDHRVFRVHVRQNPEKPAFRKILFHAHGRVGIDQCFEWIVRNCIPSRLTVEAAFQRRKRVDVMLQRTVKPVWQRWIRNPGMFRADMIWNDVKKNLHSLLVCRGDQILIILQRAEMRLDRIQVNSAVPVIVLRGSVRHNGCEPECGDTEILQIWQMILNPAQVAAMVRARFRTIVGAGRFRRLIICGITVREAVRHDEVHHVILRKPLKLAQRRSAGRNRQFEGRRALRRGDSADGGPRLRVRPNLQPDKEIVPARRGLRARDAQRWQIALDMRRFQIVSRKQQHQLWRESHPPTRRLDVCDRRSGLRGRLLRVAMQGRAATSEGDNGQKREENAESFLLRKTLKTPWCSFHGESIRNYQD